MTSAMSSVVKNTFLHFREDEQSPSNSQPALGRARTMPTPTSREGAAAEGAGLQFMRTATEDSLLSGESQGHQPDICTAATFQSSVSEASAQVSASIKNTFLHFDSFDSSPIDQPSLGRAHTMPTSSSQEREEQTPAVEGSRFSMPADREDSSDTASVGPQPDICRDMTYDAFDEPGRLDTFDELEPQPDICRDNTFDTFDAEAPPPSPADSRMAKPEPQQVKEKPAPPMAWQAQPQAATNVGTVVLPNLLMAAPQVVQGGGQPTIMLLGMPTAAQMAVPEPVKPTAPAPKASPSGRQGGRRQAAGKASMPSTPPPAPGACDLTKDGDTLRLRWTVDARKLRKNERVIVSPLFDMPIEETRSVPFRLMLFPSKGAGSFRASNGVGTMLLKCEATAQDSPDCSLDLHFIVGRQPPRGPVIHNFAQSGVCSLPEEQQEWGFARATDQASQTVGICLEVVRH